jgi:hypothetical protein
MLTTTTTTTTTNTNTTTTTNTTNTNTTTTITAQQQQRLMRDRWEDRVTDALFRQMKRKIRAAYLDTRGGCKN